MGTWSNSAVATTDRRRGSGIRRDRGRQRGCGDALNAAIVACHTVSGSDSTQQCAYSSSTAPGFTCASSPGAAAGTSPVLGSLRLLPRDLDGRRRPGRHGDLLLRGVDRSRGVVRVLPRGLPRDAVPMADHAALGERRMSPEPCAYESEPTRGPCPMIARCPLLLVLSLAPGVLACSGSSSNETPDAAQAGADAPDVDGSGNVSDAGASDAGASDTGNDGGPSSPDAPVVDGAQRVVPTVPDVVPPRALSRRSPVLAGHPRLLRALRGRDERSDPRR